MAALTVTLPAMRAGESLRVRIGVPDVPTGARLTEASVTSAGGPTAGTGGVLVRETGVDVVPDVTGAASSVDLWIDAPAAATSVVTSTDVLTLTTDAGETLVVLVKGSVFPVPAEP